MLSLFQERDIPSHFCDCGKLRKKDDDLSISQDKKCEFLMRIERHIPGKPASHTCTLFDTGMGLVGFIERLSIRRCEISSLITFKRRKETQNSTNKRRVGRRRSSSQRFKSPARIETPETRKQRDSESAVCRLDLLLQSTQSCYCLQRLKRRLALPPPPPPRTSAAYARAGSAARKRTHTHTHTHTRSYIHTRTCIEVDERARRGGHARRLRENTERERERDRESFYHLHGTERCIEGRDLSG
uniref:Uncharacterized protein n=1 Tax=Trichogramma kaykai TaxID=54128 RepID=A0ABD2VSQ0_9HYME